MDKFSVNFKDLEDSLSKEAQSPVYKYADVKHRLEKVAFDIVRFVDTDNIDGLWQIKNTEDGDLIVAMYNDEELIAEGQVEKTASDWTALPGKFNDVTLFYKNHPVTKISLAKLGFNNEPINLVCKTLSDKLSSNDKLLQGLLSYMSDDERKDLLKVNPELSRFNGWNLDNKGK